MGEWEETLELGKSARLHLTVIVMEGSGGECSTVQCSTVQCSTAQCSTVQCSTVQCSTVQCSTVQCSKDVGGSGVECRRSAEMNQVTPQTLHISKLPHYTHLQTIHIYTLSHYTHLRQNIFFLIFLGQQMLI